MVVEVYPHFRHLAVVEGPPARGHLAFDHRARHREIEISERQLVLGTGIARGRAAMAGSGKQQARKNEAAVTHLHQTPPPESRPPECVSVETYRSATSVAEPSKARRRPSINTARSQNVAMIRGSWLTMMAVH